MSFKSSIEQPRSAGEYDQPGQQRDQLMYYTLLPINCQSWSR